MDLAEKIISIMGEEEGSRFIYLLRKKPKWILILLELRKKHVMNLHTAEKIARIRYSSLRNMIAYFSQMTPPRILLEEPTKKEKFIILTETGRTILNAFIKAINSYIKENIESTGIVSGRNILIKHSDIINLFTREGSIGKGVLTIFLSNPELFDMEKKKVRGNIVYLIRGSQ